jgi:hypothetical protein
MFETDAWFLLHLDVRGTGTLHCTGKVPLLQDYRLTLTSYQLLKIFLDLEMNLVSYLPGLTCYPHTPTADPENRAVFFFILIRNRTQSLNAS